MPAIDISTKWTSGERMLFRWMFVFVPLFIISFSFPHEWLPDTGAWLSPVFERMARWTGVHIFRMKEGLTYSLLSDSTGFYLHALNMLTLSGIASVVWTITDKQRESYPRLLYWLMVIVRYYLAMQLLWYGWNKVFKWQFYLPEPNILFTRMGDMGKDLLYWSALGVSRPYVVATGCFEVLAGALLFFRRTQLAGALLAAVAMAHIALINFSFDISVKLYSLFLLLLCLVLIVPHWKRLWRALTLQPAGAESGAWRPAFASSRYKWVYGSAKLAVLLLLLGDSLALYVRTGNYNDDSDARPPLHGAYEAEIFIRNGDTLPPLITDPYRWRRAFVHRRGYLIVQKMDDAMQDFELDTDTAHRMLWVSQPQDTVETAWQYVPTDVGNLSLHGWIADDSVSVFLRKIPLEKLQVLQREFNWTTDD